MEALAIQQVAHRDDRTQEGHVSLKETARDAKNAADHLGGERGAAEPELDRNGR